MDSKFFQKTPQEQVDYIAEQWNSLEFSEVSEQLEAQMNELMRSLGNILFVYPDLQMSVPPLKAYEFGPAPMPIYPQPFKSVMTEEFKCDPVEMRETPVVVNDIQVAKNVMLSEILKEHEMSMEIRIGKRNVKATIAGESLSDLSSYGLNPFDLTYSKLLEELSMAMYVEKYNNVFPNRIYEVKGLNRKDREITRLKNGEKVLVKFIDYKNMRAKGITYDFEGITPEMGFDLPLKNLTEWQRF